MKILLCLMLCLMLASCSGCLCLGCQSCEEYQDVASVNVNRGDRFLLKIDSPIDSFIMIANDSITGCGRYSSKAVGSKTHRVKFPINVRIQLFSQGDLWKEFSVEMDKNTKITVFTGHGCSLPSSSYGGTFSNLLELTKKQNRFINLAFTNDYCWLLEKMEDSYDDMRCTEWNVSGENDLCEQWY